MPGGVVPMTNEQMLEHLLTNVRPVEGCMLWAGCLTSNGYPRISWNHKAYQAKRLLLQLQGRRLPRGWVVWSTCNERTCMHPEHLKIGKRGDAIRANAKMGNMCSGIQRSLVAVKTSAPTARMGVDKAREVLAMRAYGMTNVAIAKVYGVHPTAVGHAIRRWMRLGITLYMRAA